jgi:hypothetical protein
MRGIVRWGQQVGEGPGGGRTAHRLGEVIPPGHVANQSILDYTPQREFDLVLIKSVLIHMDPVVPSATSPAR